MMRKTFAVLLSAALLVSMAAAMGGETIGGDVGYYQVNAGIDGADVTFDNDFKGTTGEDGSLTVDVYVTGTPYTTYTVEKQGYETYSGKITKYPAAGEIVQLSANMEPQLIGGDMGYYKITTNVVGANVYFDNDFKGTTGEDSSLTVDIYVTGTPYTTYRVEMPGYTTYTGKITDYPAAGEIVQLSADLVMIPVTAMPTEPTQSPFPIAGIFGLAALGAFALSRRE
ncbi:hypothetical protein [Methanogenium sp. MK-MG]|uniref:hypothetical protein n=1 Tax=Methanogenium sp. MK-MG TaxID=2599926 RepID=UPI0020B11B25|nr:hypothetical protein [Methanogenium sp. MK-MG]KAF1078143.1 hypothetical protein MKMG_00949 [Methanogenium sp. MK-MG]